MCCLASKLTAFTGKKEIELPSTALDRSFDSRPNTKWIVRIRTKNAIGASPWSNELVLITAEGAPSAPTNVAVDVTGPHTTTVTWEAPDEPNGQITGKCVGPERKITVIIQATRWCTR